ncbi:MAG TPA: methylated-DNA--[protein]-cysteine S-methyltransferase [Pirellulales bacterium]|jgi:AraC family transcriptional regulator of adaptative response/methylated-DNA-[protein]-cysteine methyltransferase
MAKSIRNFRDVDSSKQARDLPSRASSIQYGFVQTSLGLAIVGTTHEGIRTVLFGNKRPELVASLRQRFPASRLEAGNDSHSELAERVGRYIDGVDTDFGAEVDLVGTELQKRVWSALRKIPAGATRSYSEIALCLDGLGTAQDVAAACSENPLAVVVPCHRVIRKDGSLAGYRWGLWRKKRLLAREQPHLDLSVKAASPTTRQRQLPLFDANQGSLAVDVELSSPLI